MTQTLYHAIARIHWKLHSSHVGMMLLHVMMLTGVQIHAQCAMPKILPIHLNSHSILRKGNDMCMLQTSRMCVTKKFVH